MRITCTGPGGERFEAEGTCYRGTPENVKEAAREERSAIQRALETWCKTVKANAKDAKED